MIVPETRFDDGNFWAVAQSVLHHFSGWLNLLKMLMITVSRIVFNPLLYRLSYRARARNCNITPTGCRDQRNATVCATWGEKALLS
jgi:hypothetical protein